MDQYVIGRLVMALAPREGMLRAIGRRTTLDGSSLAIDQCRDSVLDDYGVRITDEDVVRLADPMIRQRRLIVTRSGRLTIASATDPVLASLSTHQIATGVSHRRAPRRTRQAHGRRR